MKRMEKIIIRGGRPLSGEITVNGAKNSIVALLPAAILADAPVILEGVPDILDVRSFIEILESMGSVIKFENNVLIIDSSKLKSIPMLSGKINSLRASYYLMGALLSKFGEVVVGLPGGCNLGPRPIDLHFKGFEALGARIFHENEVVCLQTGSEGLKGNHIFMDTVSVGATINIILAAVKATGETVIENAAREPEIIDVATLLNNMGARIRGVGTNEIRIEGVEKLSGARHFLIPDRIEAGTYLAMAAAVGEGITVKNVLHEHLESYLLKLEEMNVKVTISENSIFVPAQDKFKAVNVKTSPYPGLATDLQQPMTSLLLKSYGKAELIDMIYEGRIGHVSELQKMGANILIDGNKIVIEAPNKLKGTDVFASDLRAGASLVIAGLMANGFTTIHNAKFILRGYDRMVEKLTQLGADISLIEMVDDNKGQKIEERGEQWLTI